MYIFSLNSSWKNKYFAQTLYRKSKHAFSAQYVSSENRAVYEIMWKNMVQLELVTDDIIRCVRFACCITKATDTLRIFSTYCFGAGRVAQSV